MATGQQPRVTGQIVQHPASASAQQEEPSVLSPPAGIPDNLVQGLLVSRMMLQRFLQLGPNAEYQKYASAVRMQTGRSTFDFVMDAIEGTGGFEDGSYLDPHYREVQGADVAGVYALGGGAGGETRKFRTRRHLADYDNFVKTVCDTPWTYIQQSRDMIRRTTTDPRLDRFWADADLNRTFITDFMGAPARQSNAFGTGVVIVDRPAGIIASEKDNEAPENRPYAYLVPTRNIVDWRLDDDGRLLAIVIIEPTEEAEAQQTIYGSVADFPMTPQPVRVWTQSSWSVWSPAINIDDKTGKEIVTYSLDGYGENPLGEVPAVTLFHDAPLPGQFYGRTHMKDVALVGKTVFNIDSEIREVERNCAFPVFCIPMKDPTTVRTLVISTEGALGYDGDRGAPAFVSADLGVLVRLQERRDKKVEQAYAMAHLAVVSGFIRTTSGFHTQAEFDQTNRALGVFAAALEDAEMKIARLVLRWYGVTDEEIQAGGRELFSVVYPRNFGLRDLDAVILRAVELLSLGLGPEANLQFLADMFDALYPRWTQQQVKDAAQKAANYLEMSGGVPAPGGIGEFNSGLRSGVKGIGGIGKRADPAKLMDTKIMRIRRMVNQIKSDAASAPAVVGT